MKKVLIIVAFVLLTTLGGYCFWFEKQQVDQAQSRIKSLQDASDASIDHMVYDTMIDKYAPSNSELRKVQISFQPPMAWKTQITSADTESNLFGLNSSTDMAKTLASFRIAQLQNTTVKNPFINSSMTMYDVTNWAHMEFHLPPNADDNTKYAASFGFISTPLAKKQAYIKFMQSFDDGHILSADERKSILLPNEPVAHPAGIPYARAITTSQGRGILYVDMVGQQLGYSPMLRVHLIQNVGSRYVFTAAEFESDDETSKKLKESRTVDVDPYMAAINKYKSGDFEPVFRSAIDEVISVIKTIRIDEK